MYFKEVFTKALSVDTPKDLEKVINLMKARLKNE